MRLLYLLMDQDFSLPGTGRVQAELKANEEPELSFTRLTFGKLAHPEHLSEAELIAEVTRNFGKADNPESRNLLAACLLSNQFIGFERDSVRKYALSLLEPGMNEPNVLRVFLNQLNDRLNFPQAHNFVCSVLNNREPIRDVNLVDQLVGLMARETWSSTHIELCPRLGVRPSSAVCREVKQKFLEALMLPHVPQGLMRALAVSGWNGGTLVLHELSAGKKLNPIAIYPTGDFYVAFVGGAFLGLNLGGAVGMAIGVTAAVLFTYYSLSNQLNSRLSGHKRVLAGNAAKALEYAAICREATELRTA